MTYFKEEVDHRGKREGYQGKARQEDSHPYDRRPGTGRGREFRKDGAGRGNWGNEKKFYKKDEEEEPKNEGEEEKEEGEGATEEPAKEEKAEPEPPRESSQDREEKKGMTLEDYMATRKMAGIKKEAR